MHVPRQVLTLPYHFILRPRKMSNRKESTTKSSTNSGGAKEPIHTDVVVIGAGFSGISAIYRLRKKGLNVKTFEAGSDFGGVWYWNKYPGARVDSETPFYQLNIPEASTLAILSAECHR